MSDDTHATSTPSESLLGLNVQPRIVAENITTAEGNPTGGHVILGIEAKGTETPVLHIEWQNGPRTPDAEGNLAPSNGAFVEDVIWAALQRLEFFQTSKYAHEANANAITHLEAALRCLNRRRTERADRGVEGKHEV